MGLEWVLLIGLAAAGLGGLVGYKFNAANKVDKERIAELTEQVAGKEDELREYRAEVLSQFAATADKFKSLDESYHALHRQLAASSVALCGDQATPLLPQTEQTLIAGGMGGVEEAPVAEEAEKEVEPVEGEPVVVAEADAMSRDAEQSNTEDEPDRESEHRPEVVAEAEDVPTLTENIGDEVAEQVASEEAVRDEMRNDIKDELAEKRAS